MRVFLDTNVLVAAFATRGLCADVLHTVIADHHLVLGDTVLSELARVQRSKFGLPDEIVEETLDFLRREATVTSASVDPDVILRDTDDLRVLGEALASGADLLVTGDHDLLDVSEKLPLPVLTPRAFWERLRLEE